MEDALPGLGELPQFGEQGSLLDAAPSTREVIGDVPAPVAHVHLEMPQPHMDRVFDYLVPKKLDESARVGTRVMVDVGARRVPGFIVNRDSTAGAGAQLRPLRRVVSPIPVLSSDMYELCQEVATTQASSVADVLRLAVVPRHARAEKEFAEAAAPVRVSLEPQESSVDPGLWENYRGGPAFIARIAGGGGPQAICAALPGQAGSIRVLATSCTAAIASGRSALLIAPTTRDAYRLAERLRELTGVDVALFLGEAPSSERYRTFLEILSGHHAIVVGTRGAMWAPLPELGLCVVIDDAADTLREPRSPYVNVRDVLALRAQRAGAAFLVYSPYVTEESAGMVMTGAAALLEGVQPRIPRVSTPAQWDHEHAHWARLPEAAFRVVRDGLSRGPVLILVPRAGYLPIVACTQCGSLATCGQCGGALSIRRDGEAPTCTRCGAMSTGWTCSQCHGTHLRAARIGSHRTAEELGRAFPGTGILMSGAAEGISQTVSGKRRLIIATPGSEPAASGGYAAALILDARYLMGSGLGAETQFIRRCTRVIVRVQPGGHVMIAGGADPGIVTALQTWQLGRYSYGLLKDRTSLALPPIDRWFGITGAPRDIRRFLALVRMGQGPASGRDEIDLLASGVQELIGGVELLGPTPASRDGEITMYVRTQRQDATKLAIRLRRTYRSYSASGVGQPLKIEADPSM